MRQRIRALIYLLVSLGFAALCWQIALLIEADSREELRQRAAQNLQLYVSHLNGELSRYEYLPRLLATYEGFAQLLGAPREGQRLRQVNHHLRRLSEITNASAIYLMDATGLTLAASNWDQSYSFVGKNFSFRPYFQEAMSGGLGRYFALGTTSLRRGYYFSYPVQRQGAILGVLVVKVDIATAEARQIPGQEELIVTDPAGVVFISSRPEWRYHTLGPLPAEVKSDMIRERRYGSEDLKPLPLVSRRVMDEDTRLRRWVMARAEGGGLLGQTQSEYLVQSIEMADAGWEVHILSNMAEVRQQLTAFALIALLAYSSLVLFYLALRQRHKRFQERVSFEQAAKRESQRNEARVRAIIDNTQAGLITLNERFLIKTLNQTAEQLFGASTPELRGRPFLELLAVADRAPFEAAFIKQDPMADYPRGLEVQGVCAGDQVIPLEVSLRALGEATDSAYILTLHDIRERKQYEQELEHAHALLERRVLERTQDLTLANTRLTQEIDERRRAEETLRLTQDELIQAAKLAGLGQVSAGINHELNQPLAAIRNYADNARAFLARGREEEASWNLTQIGELTERMAEIITQLKIFARKSTGQNVPVSLGSALERTLRLMDNRLRQAGVEVIQQPQWGEGLVLADMVRLEQVFVNLVSNAVQAMESGGLARRLEIGGHCSGETTQIWFRDRGPGIEAEHIQHIFDPFYTTKAAGQGLGLGLSISYRIVEGFGGSLKADNHPDGGALFTLTLQTATEEEQYG